jgi:hypothetical protein
MPGPSFIAEGKTLNVEKFIEGSSLRPRCILIRGKPLPSKHNLRSAKPRIATTNRIIIEIADEFGEIAPQVVAAERFLTDNASELKRLGATRGVTDMRIIMSFCPGNDRLTFDEYFPPKLLAAAGSLGIGIGLSVYPGDNKWLRKRKTKNQKALVQKFLDVF